MKYPEGKSHNLRYPERCRSCDSKYRRYKRRKHRINRIWQQSSGFIESYPGMSRPKLITFALPSQRSSCYEDRENQMDLLDSKLEETRFILKSNGVLGGIYVMECTSRLVPFSDGGVLLEWKHHAHVHMVAISPYVHHTKLKAWCEQLMNIGLGRINYKAPKQAKVVANYISKYLSKENQRFRSFGMMRGLPKVGKQCWCKHEDMLVTERYCECFDALS